MVDISILDTLPEIDLLADENISLGGIQQGMIADMQEEYERLSGEALELKPTDPYRLLINATSAPLYQLAVIANEKYKQNFIAYMFYESTRHWGANFGYLETGEEKATTILQFVLSAESDNDITIPEGTQVTDGNEIYFATDEDLIIASGDLSGEISATCTESGTAANDLAAGSLSILTDPIDLIESVENITVTAGGADPYTNDELKEKVLNFMNVYSVAGPEAAYEVQAMAYSNIIADAKAIGDDNATVNLYIILKDGLLPSADFCSAVENYIKEEKRIPDTDKVEVSAPDDVSYSITATYYISTDKRSIEADTKTAIEGAVSEFVEDTAGKIGKAINPDDLISYMKAAGARRITLSSPSYQSIDANEVALCTEINLTYGGLEED